MRRIKFFQVEWLIVLAIASSITARGQIGTGWTEVHPRLQVQLRGTGPSYRANNGVETFSLTNSFKDGDERAEVRVWNDYNTGIHQFEGYLKVTRLDGTSINLKQTFLSGNGAWFLCTVDKAMHGTLRDHKDKNILATNVLGRTVRLNTIHDMNTGKFHVYVDGILKLTKTSDIGVSFNDKYGAYRSTSGYGPISVEWTRYRNPPSPPTNRSSRRSKPKRSMPPRRPPLPRMNPPIPLPLRRSRPPSPPRRRHRFPPFLLPSLRTKAAPTVMC